MARIAIRGAIALLLSCGSAQAQHPPATPDSAASIAWTAYRAVEARDRSQVPKLEAALTRLVGSRRFEEQLALRAVIDALVQLGARPALSLVRHAYERHPVEAVILLKRFGAERDSVALPLFRETRGHLSYALADMLAQTRARGFAAELAGGVRVRAAIFVSDIPGHGGGLSGGSSGATRCGADARAPGFPPLATYEPLLMRVRGAVLLSGGPRPVYYLRKVWREGRAPAASGSPGTGPTTDDRVAIAMSLLHLTRTPLRGHEDRTVLWAGPAALQHSVRAFTADIENRFSWLVDSLHAGGWLTTSELGTLKPKIEVEVHDIRVDRSDPLFVSP